METRADRIRMRLTALKISAAEASRRCKRSVRFVADILENPDQSPSTENMRRLAEVLQTTPDWIDHGIKPPTPPIDKHTSVVLSAMPKLSEAARRRIAEMVKVEAKLERIDKK